MAALALENRSLQTLLSKRIEFVAARRPYGSPLAQQRMPRSLLDEPSSQINGNGKRTLSTATSEDLSVSDLSTPPTSAQSSSKNTTTPEERDSSSKAGRSIGVGEQPAEPKKILFKPEELSYNWSKEIRHPPPGLHNLGNTCFLNSAMQAIMHIPSLVQHLLSQAHSPSCRASNCVLCELEKHAMKAYPAHGRGKSFRPGVVGQLKREFDRMSWMTVGD